MSAVLGDDGRYHLAGAGRARCAGRRFPGATTGSQCHRVEVRLPAPVEVLTQAPRASWHTAPSKVFITRWIVRLTESSCEPAEVSPPMRCPIDPLEWPTYIDLAKPLGRVRAALVEALGSVCHACHRRFATCVDHDHETGMIRGLLCRRCNAHIDACCHLHGCVWADYLNDPPAAELAMRYPHHSKMIARRQRGNRYAEWVAEIAAPH